MESYSCGDDDARFWERYDEKPGKDKEAFADRYAQQLHAKFEANGQFPFVQRWDEKGR